MVKKAWYYLYSIGELLGGFREPALVLKIFLLPLRQRRFLLTLRKNSLRFFVRSALDVWSIKETFLDNFYLPPGFFNIERGWIMMDIGAGVGDFSLLASSLAPQGRIFAFEAFPETFSLLQENVNLNGLPNILVSPEAISAKDGYLFMDRSAVEPLQLSTRTQANSHRDLRVPAVSLEHIFERYQLPFCNLLKLDCEGAEYEILFSLSPAVLQRIEAVTMEYHDGVAAYNHQDLVNFFHDHNFKVQVQPNLVHSDLGYLYAKKEENP